MRRGVYKHKKSSSARSWGGFISEIFEYVVETHLDFLRIHTRRYGEYTRDVFYNRFDYIVLRCSKAAFTKLSSGLISLAIVAYFVASALLGVSIDT